MDHKLRLIERTLLKKETALKEIYKTHSVRGQKLERISNSVGKILVAGM